MARCHAPKLAPTSAAVITDTLEAVAREGARRTGYRNGYGRPREIGIAAAMATALHGRGVRYGTSSA